MIPTQYALKTVFPEAGMAPFQRLLLGGNYLFGAIPSPLMALQPGSAMRDARSGHARNNAWSGLAHCQIVVGSILG
ncbi:hypothetical protein ACSQ67_007744 [Phaseolus vulgaris]